MKETCGARSQAGERGIWELDRLVSISGAEVKGGRKWRQTALGHRECGGLGTQAPSSTQLGPSCRL